MSLVIDSSIVLAWVYADETTAPVTAVLEALIADGAWVPGIWPLEVANVLEMGVRRGRNSSEFRDSTLADLALLPIRIDPDTSANAWGATLKLAERHKLTVYDAAYLELALRRSHSLATLDGELRAAAAVENVTLLGL